MSANQIVDFAVCLFFPKFCLGCHTWGKYVCNKCAENKIEYFNNQVCPYCEKLSPHGLTHAGCERKDGLDGLFVLCHYRSLIPKAIHEIKYQGYFAIIFELADLIAQKYHNQFIFQYFVPVPLSKIRKNLRGFNQAEKLADALNQIFRTKHKTAGKARVINLLERVRNTKPQFELKYEARQQNVKGAFALRTGLENKNLNGLSFCLIDDVATTGSTLFECAKVLKKAGAEKVFAITIARGG